MNLTLACVRGCGSRTQPGSLYLYVGVGPEGVPVWHFLTDPPIPFVGSKFQGVHQAPPEMTVGWPDDTILLLDMVGESFYESAPSFIEEARRFGFSRRIPETFDFESLAGKKVYLGLIHWKASPEITSMGFPPGELEYKFCMQWDALEHRNMCVFHDWPLSVDLHPGHVQETRPETIHRPSFVFQPNSVLTQVSQLVLGPNIRDVFPAKVTMTPGVFAIVPITHVEAIGHVPFGSSVVDSGLPIVTMDK